jgi:hypothetical protein
MPGPGETRAHMGQVVVVLPSGYEEIMTLQQARTLNFNIDTTCQDMEVEGDWNKATALARHHHMSENQGSACAANIDDHYYHVLHYQDESCYIRRCNGLYTYDVVLERGGCYQHHRITVTH